jgi:ABC-type branched-subunit amino acid transport system permease subunit
MSDAAAARPGSSAAAPPRWRAAALGAVAALFGYGLLSAETERSLGLLLAAAVALVLAGGRLGLLAPAARAAVAHERTLALTLALAVLAVTALFHEDHFTLLLLGRVLLTAVACLGLHVQFGQAGVVNFAGAAFFGVGGYTAAVLAARGVPHLAGLAAGGLAAAAIGSLLLLPLLRTRGHYAALITIAFGLLFRTFLEVNDALGGPQGLRLPGLRVLGFDFNDGRAVGERELSFYVPYVLLALALTAAAFALVRRLETSWVGLALDAVRLDETAAACFGMSPARWKIAAFTLGNVLTGVAGALSAHLVGFIAPTNFTFRESLVFVSIVLLGGIGNPWGLALASFLVVVVPEKLQVIQEYRYLLFAVLVVLVLVFRPAGLVPRTLRRSFGSPA